VSDTAARVKAFVTQIIESLQVMTSVAQRMFFQGGRLQPQLRMPYGCERRHVDAGVAVSVCKLQVSWEMVSVSSLQGSPGSVVPSGRDLGIGGEVGGVHMSAATFQPATARSWHATANSVNTAQRQIPVSACNACVFLVFPRKCFSQSREIYLSNTP